ncbi:MAG: hypothetical protein JW876_03310 [Candidatus Krumholzibacteriota bacterium]|nr:hypothetical protein [Candidatus Krumholzibacteriota bacterium]
MNRRVMTPILLAGALAIAACAGNVDDPRVLVDRMIGAYGGEKGIERVENFVGKGFMRSLSNKAIATSHPFDLRQSGARIKTKMMRVERGRLVDVKIISSDGTNSWQYDWLTGRRDLAGWETEITAWRFPRVLRWAHEHVASASVVPDDIEYGVALVAFEAGEDLVTLKIDEESWLLREVVITSLTDTSFVFSEQYGDYRVVDGTPFPNRFTGTYMGQPYFEYMIPVLELGVTSPDSLFGVLHADTADIYRPTAAGDTTAATP